MWGLKHLWFLVGFKKCPTCANLYIAYFFTQITIVDCKDNVDHPVKRLLESLKIISYFHFSLVVRLIWLLGLNFTVCQVRWARRVTPWKWVLLDRASRPKKHFFYYLKNWNIFSISSVTFWLPVASGGAALEANITVVVVLFMSVTYNLLPSLFSIIIIQN